VNVFREQRHTGDVDLQHDFYLGERNHLVWGAGYRVTSDDVVAESDFRQYYDPPSATKQTASAFAQDEITLVEKRLKATVGSKFEHNDYTGFEVQPSLRLVFTPVEKHVFWSAISRAARTPSREESDLEATSRDTVIVGNPDLSSEYLMAYEMGYRYVPRPSLSLDLATFYNVYDEMRTMEILAVQGGTTYLTSRNHGYGETEGVELAATWRPVDCWRLTASYTFVQVQLHLRSGVTNPGFETVEGNTPHHQAQLHSYLDLPAHFEFDQGVYYVDTLPNQGVASYLRYDLGLGWRPCKTFEARLGFQDLLPARHAEFGGGSVTVERSLFGQITVRF
jgi:iron complex outermembrane recepter protein